jgi:hypothetical protein
MYYPPPGASHAATKGLEAAATTFTLNELGEKGAVVAGERVGDVEVEETGAEAAAEVVQAAEMEEEIAEQAEEEAVAAVEDVDPEAIGLEVRLPAHTYWAIESGP